MIKKIPFIPVILFSLIITSCGGEQPVFQKLKFVVTVDGLMELFNENNELWGIESIQPVLCNSGTENAEQILGAILGSAEKWRGETALKDDLTLVVVKQKE